MSEPLVVDARVTIDANELSWKAVRASGPGGQNVNKVSSKVELRFDLEGTRSIDVLVKVRLRAQAKRYLASDGALVVSSQTHRDQLRNLEEARDKLAALIRAAMVMPKPRANTKPTRASKLRRLDGKRHDAEKKRNRRVDE